LVKADNFERLPRPQLESMLAAGDEVVECLRLMAENGSNPVAEVLRDQGTFYEHNHYPNGDVFDRHSHAQYYYHAHRGANWVEHGHFHAFLRAPGMPDGVRPAKTKHPSDGEDVAHLVAISMDDHGLPIRLFTVNRWVTDETWYRARDVVAMLDRFLVDNARPSWAVNRWIGAMLRLYKPQIVDLIRRRDAAVAAWAAKKRDGNVFEDRELEVTAVAEIFVERQIRQIRRALG